MNEYNVNELEVGKVYVEKNSNNDEYTVDNEGNLMVKEGSKWRKSAMYYNVATKVIFIKKLPKSIPFIEALEWWLKGYAIESCIGTRYVIEIVGDEDCCLEDDDEFPVSCVEIKSLWNVLESPENIGTVVLSEKDIESGEQPKDLRELLVDGRVLEFRDGSTGFVINNRVVAKDRWFSFVNIKNDLKGSGFKKFDIMAIYEDHPGIWDCYYFGCNVKEVLEKGYLKPVWKREE